MPNKKNRGEKIKQETWGRAGGGVVRVGKGVRGDPAAKPTFEPKPEWGEGACHAPVRGNVFFAKVAAPAKAQDAQGKTRRSVGLDTVAGTCQ